MPVLRYADLLVPSWLCPPMLRPAVTAIYSFTQTADGLADQPMDVPEQRLAALSQYRDDLRAAARGADPSQRWAHVFGPLQVALRRHGLPVALLESLLTATEQNILKARYADRDELLEHCSRAANPVGRLLLHLHGVRDDVSLRQSDYLCTALQLIHFWRNLSVDLRRGRVYVPLAECAREAVEPVQLLTLQHDRATRRLIARMAAWARELLCRGAPLAKRLSGRAGWELRLIVQAGMRLLEKIEAIQHATLNSRPALTWHDAPLIFVRASRM